MNYQGYKTKKEQLSAIVRNVIDIITESGYNEISGDGTTPVEDLNETQARLEDQNLRVLVMGKFSSGKSAFLNGMMGQPLLPMGALPKTAVIAEIKYSDKPKVTLTPKKGKWTKGDAPFTIQVNELDKYTSIEHTSDVAKENPFQLAEIEYPLAICRQGIEFVDSPGLDDPTSHDEVTKQYLPTADAIIYCMSSLQAYSSKDKNEIDSLRAMGYKSIIFVLTYYDQLVRNDEMMGTRDAEELRTNMLSTLAPLTDLGKSGIFFVNSLAAIMGKKNNNSSLLASSNFPDLEQKVEQILVNEKGRLKLIRSVYKVKGINKRAGKFLRDTIEIANKDHSHFANNLNLAQTALSAAKQKSQNIENAVKYGINDIANGSKDKGELFLMSSIIPSVESWVNDYSAEVGINILQLKSSITKYTEEHIENIKSKMSTALSNWCENNLVKNYIAPQFERILIEQRNNLQQFEDDLSRVRVNLELPIDGDEIGSGIAPSDANRIASAGASLLIGDIFGAITGGALGFKAMLTTLAYEVTAGIVLGIVGMFTPVGLPAMIIAAIIAAIGGFGTNVLSIKNEVKKKIINKTKDILSSGEKKMEFGESIHDAVEKSLLTIKEKLNEELQIPINESQRLVDQAREDMSETGVELSRKVTRLKEVLQRQEEAENELDAFSFSINS